MSEDTALKNTIHLPCPSCGNQLNYSAEVQKIVCNYCGHQEELDRSTDKIQEQSLDAAIRSLSYFEADYLDKKVFDCHNCSAKIMVELDSPKINCGFCGSSNVNIDAFDNKYVQPNGILPFQLSRSQAESYFSKWISKGWFHPSKLKRLEPEDLHGVYIPFWTYDAEVEAEWSGEAGQYYYESITVMVDGKPQQKRVRKTRWHWRSGTLAQFFDDILVSASKSLEQKIVERILPFQMDALINFDPKLILGWEAEIYATEVDRGYRIAEGIINQKVRELCKQRLGGDTQRNLQVQSSFTDQSFKHIMLPIWICSYLYQNKLYRFTINGQTGKIYGKKPISYIKIGILILAIAAIVLLIFWLKNK